MLLTLLNLTSCWGVLLTLIGYWIGVVVQGKTKRAWCNPMLLCTIIIIVILLVTGIPYEEYKESAYPVSFLLLPGTVCLAIPLYEQWELLRKNLIAIISGILVGTLTSLGSIVAIARLLHLDRVYAATLLPKSATTAIGIEIAESLGGIKPLAAALIIMTGMTGHLIASWLFKILGVSDPLAKGIALGTTSHALGTAKAIEMGAVEGAMSGLAIVVAGIMTAVLAPLFAKFLP